MTTEVDQMADEYRRRRDSLDLFDANCWWGEPLEPTFLPLAGAGELKAALARYGIRRAVVSHTMCVRYDAAAGNRALVEAIRNDDALVGAATLVPEMAESGTWSGVLQSLIDAGIRLVRLFPASHNFVLDGEFLAGLPVALQELRIPVVLWHSETGWRELAAFCAAYPELKVIVEGTGKKLFYGNRSYYSLLARFPNLYLETHNLTNYLGLDDLVRRFGSQRFLFGSYFPHQDPNSAAMLLSHGEMTQEDQLNIAHRNLARLIAEVAQP